MNIQVTVRLPDALRQFAGGRSEFCIEARSVEELIANAAKEGYETLVHHICTRDGQLRPYVNLYVGDRSIRALNGLKTKLDNGDVITILPSIAGG